MKLVKLAVGDSDLFVVESPEDKTIEPLSIGTAVVTKQTDGMRLSQSEPLRTVRAVVNAGGVTTERDVAREFIDFIPEVQAGPRPRIQRQAIA